jgi:hypothetical protein
MAKTWPPRPEQDLRITSLQSQLETEANHRRAGFPPVEHEVVRRRFWQFLSFLQRHSYLVHPTANTIDDLEPTAELRNADLTDAGYTYVQRYVDRWSGRMYKDRGPEAERMFLEKWHKRLLSEQRDA